MSKLKVGDRVRFNEDSLYDNGPKTGDIGNIVEIKNHSKYPFLINLDKNNSKWQLDSLIFNLMDESNEVDKPKSLGRKNDTGKPRISLIPKDAIWGMANGLTYGEKKYGTHNFRNGIQYSRLADACFRHLTAWLECENIDKESGNSHLDHALASLAMLKFMEIQRPEMDDRWSKKDE